MMYLSSSGLRSNYEGESRIHVCALAKPLVSPGCLPHFPTLPLKQHLYYHVNSGDSSIQMSLEGSHSRSSGAVKNDDRRSDYRDPDYANTIRKVEGSIIL